MKFSLEWLSDFVDTGGRGRPRGRARACSTGRDSPSNRSKGRAPATIFDVEITPNRPDVMSHRGLAREIAAMASLPLLPLPAGEGRGEGASVERAHFRHDRGPAPLPPLRRPGRLRASPPARRRRSGSVRGSPRSAQVHQRRRGRDQLRDVGDRPAAPRLRSRPARGPAHRRPQGAPGREARDPRRHREDSRSFRHRRGGRRAGGLARRRHGRARHRGDLRDEERPSRSRVVGSAVHPEDIPASGAPHGRLAPLRARGRPRGHPGGARPRGRDPPRIRRRDARARLHGRPRRRLEDPARRASPLTPEVARGDTGPRHRLRGGGSGAPRIRPREEERTAARRDGSFLAARRVDRGRPRRGGPSSLRVRPSSLASAAGTAGRRAPGAACASSRSGCPTAPPRPGCSRR